LIHPALSSSSWAHISSSAPYSQILSPYSLP
jgi:hypothetical protein